MRDYIIRRVLLIIPTLLLVTIVVFFLVRFIPGDVIDLMTAEMAVESGMGSELSAEMLREALGLDVSVPVQYARWLGIAPYPDIGFDGLFQGSLGKSLWKNTRVTEEVFVRIPVSFELGFIALVTALLIALPIGVYSAIRQDTGLDYIGRTTAILFISLPSFWIGTMVIVYPSIWWNFMPPLEYTYLWQNPIQNLAQTILPALILGMVLSGGTMRMTRTMMLEVLRQDYIRTAWAKGLREWTIIIRHVMKNALIPVVTMVGNQIPILIGGTVVLESIFAIPGVGRLMIEALNKRDYPIISGINLVVAIVVVFTNLTIDLAYGWLDPRVHYR